MKAITNFIYSAFAVVIMAISAINANATSGDVFVSDVGHNVIHKFAPNGTEYSLFATGLASPEGLAFDSVGNLFEADYGSNTIYKFTPDGTRSVFVTNVSPLGPYGLAFDSAGNLFVSDGNGGTIYKFTPNGTQSTFFTGLHNPIGLAFDNAGNLFVGEASNLGYRISKIATNGTQSIFATGLHYPVGLAFDSLGYLFEADSDSGSIYKFAMDSTQTLFAPLGENGALEGLAFDSAGYLFAAAYYDGIIYKLAPSGTSNVFAAVAGNLTFIAIQPPAPTPPPSPTPTPTPAYGAQVQQPINVDGSSVFTLRRGVIPVKFTVTLNDVATCSLPSATIAVTRTGGGTMGPVDESVYSGPADNGSDFRIDSCQYVYNLSASALGVGTYRVDVIINTQVVGSASFGLR